MLLSHKIRSCSYNDSYNTYRDKVPNDRKDEKGKYIDTPVFDRYNLPPKFSLLGPAIIEEKECTVVAGPSSRVSLDSFGNLFIDLLYTDVDKKT